MKASKRQVFNRLLQAKQRRRDHISIIANILEISRGGILKTQIMYRANLSYTQLNDYLAFLLENNLITQSNVDIKGGYQITKKGSDFLQTHRELLKMMEKTSTKSKKTVAI